MNINCVVPDWLHDVILGYGDPKSAHYSEYLEHIKNINCLYTDINNSAILMNKRCILLQIAE